MPRPERLTREDRIRSAPGRNPRFEPEFAQDKTASARPRPGSHGSALRCGGPEIPMRRSAALAENQEFRGAITSWNEVAHAPCWLRHASLGGLSLRESISPRPDVLSCFVREEEPAFPLSGSPQEGETIVPPFQVPGCVGRFRNCSPSVEAVAPACAWDTASWKASWASIDARSGSESAGSAAGRPTP